MIWVALVHFPAQKGAPRSQMPSVSSIFAPAVNHFFNVWRQQEAARAQREAEMAQAQSLTKASMKRVVFSACAFPSAYSVTGISVSCFSSPEAERWFGLRIRADLHIEEANIAQASSISVRDLKSGAQVPWRVDGNVLEKGRAYREVLLPPPRDPAERPRRPKTTASTLLRTSDPSVMHSHPTSENGDGEVGLPMVKPPREAAASYRNNYK